MFKDEWIVILGKSRYFEKFNVKKLKLSDKLKNISSFLHRLYGCERFE